MNKQELLAALTNTWHNFALGLIVTQFMPDKIWDEMSQGGIRFDGPNGPWFDINADWTADILGNRQKRAKAIGELEKSLKRALIREGHELILLYCEESGQVAKYKMVSWFQFARIIRNTVSHKQGNILREWPKDLLKQGVITVSWRSRTLSSSMIEQEISFTHQEALQLFTDQFIFAQNQLS